MDVVIDETFEANYSFKVLSELTNGIEPHYFSEYGSGPGVIVEISSAGSNPWIGVFTGVNGYPKGLNGVYLTPNPDDLCVLVAGEIFYGPIRNPEDIVRVEFEPIFQAFADREHDTLILAGFTSILCVNGLGISWRSERISIDSLEISGVKNDIIFGTFWDPRKEALSEFQVNLYSGKLVE